MAKEKTVFEYNSDIVVKQIRELDLVELDSVKDKRVDDLCLFYAKSVLSWVNFNLLLSRIDKNVKSRLLKIEIFIKFLKIEYEYVENGTKTNLRSMFIKRLLKKIDLEINRSTRLSIKYDTNFENCVLDYLEYKQEYINKLKKKITNA